jgi:hypothetical protein
VNFWVLRTPRHCQRHLPKIKTRGGADKFSSVKFCVVNIYSFQLKYAMPNFFAFVVAVSNRISYLPSPSQTVNYFTALEPPNWRSTLRHHPPPVPSIPS